MSTDKVAVLIEIKEETFDTVSALAQRLKVAEFEYFNAALNMFNGVIACFLKNPNSKLILLDEKSMSYKELSMDMFAAASAVGLLEKAKK